MNYTSLSLFLLIVFAGCIGKNTVAIKSKSPKASTTTVSNSSNTITVSNIKVLNNQFVLSGTNLNSATSIVIKEGTTITTLAIESQTATALMANGLSNITLAAGKVFEFVISNASASATYTVDFSLCSSSIGGKLIDCTTTPNDKEVLAYDASAGKWKPRAVNGLSYQGVWDATGSFPTGADSGDYYIVSVASGTYAVGDWIVYNGTTFEEIDNSNTVTGVFGRTGAVTATEGDYVLGNMGDVDFVSATPTTNQFLKFNGTNWVPATLSTVESDPNVMTFAKTTLPTCASGEVLKGNGTALSCVTVSGGSGSSFSGTASRAIVTDGSGSLAVSAVTSTELGYVSGVTSAIQTQINAFQTFAKTPIPTCNAGEVLKSNGTTFSCVTDNSGSGSFSGSNNVAVITDGTGALASSAVTTTELGYVSGVTSSIQTQLNAKQATISATTDLTANSITTDSQAAVTLNPYNTGAGQTGEIRFYELAANGSNYVGLKSPDLLSANYTMTFPTTPGTPGQVLSSTGSGVLGWIDNAVGNFALTSGNIIVGSAGNVGASVTMSGDATISNTGALTIEANSVALGTDTTGNYVTSLTVSNGLMATAAAASEGSTPNLVLGGTLTDDTTINASSNKVFKIQDLIGTDFLTFTAATGITLATKLAATTADIDGGTIDATTIGATTRAAASITTLAATAAYIATAVIDNADINGGTIDSTTIGVTTRSSGAFTTVAATSAAIAGTVSAGTLLTANILGGTTTTSGLTLQTTSGVGTTTADMHFLVGNNGGTEAMTILNNGNVGIGIATPSSKLAVAGLIESTSGGLKFPDGTTQTTTSLPSTFNPNNCSLTSSNSGNALTITLVASDGSSLSSSNICTIPFRSSTITSGAIVTRNITANISITIPSATTIGAINSDDTPINVYAIDNAGTVVLGLSLTAGYSRYNIYSTSSISGGTSATTLYTTSALANVATIYLGYVEAPQVTAGTWADVATNVTYSGPRPGRLGLAESKSVNTTYKADTDGQLWTGGIGTYYYIYVGRSSTTVTDNVGYTEANGAANANGAQNTAPVRRSQYYRVTVGGGSNPTAYWIPIAD